VRLVSTAAMSMSLAGPCFTSPSGKLTLNCVLIQASVDAIDYVITLELYNPTGMGKHVGVRARITRQ
jgi:hypothetical protein